MSSLGDKLLANLIFSSPPERSNRNSLGTSVKDVKRAMRLLKYIEEEKTKQGGDKKKDEKKGLMDETLKGVQKFFILVFLTTAGAFGEIALIAVGSRMLWEYLTR